MTAYAWAKLLYLRDAGPTEVGGFGISAVGNPLLLEDFSLVRQECTAITVKFDDVAVADYFDAQVDAGRMPEEFGRIWIHTHPGNSPLPSSTDEKTFARCFGQADWAVMFILACGGKTYARLHFRAGPGGDLHLPVEIDFGRPFSGASSIAWEEEYCRCVGMAVNVAESTQLRRNKAPLMIPATENDRSLFDAAFDVSPLMWPPEIFDDRFS